ncbi:MAG TPA: protein kinase [Thermoanaerobaculia bacterium]|jgi:hypothetical protein|nr:protein kinase [Thermoanaerobaculia bacterium]
MTIAAGTHLGPYEILSPLGSGGMGEVYRARDPRLGREVAIKVLPAAFSTDRDRLRRFEQEARAAGSLNHPNITAVYDVGSVEGAPYVVSELLEGETLRSILAGRKLSTRKAIDYSVQIAHGLAAAHEKGIVHRDLKPENLFVTKDGRVKILDFGLAKLTSETVPSGPATQASTQTALTEPGVVMGTVGYMSPEQVRGNPADSRSDIFTLGVILYEMLAGVRAFRGGSAAETMAAILKEDPPDLSAVNSTVPPGLDRVVRHCLEKSAEERFQSARDLAFDLAGLSSVSGESDVAVTIGSRTGLPPDQPIYRRLTFRRGTIVTARFSPDAQTVLCSARWEGAPLETFALRHEGPESRPLGLPEARLLAISSSGEMAILLNAERNPRGGRGPGVLARMPLAGGAPRELLEDVNWASWFPDGSALAVVRVVGGRECLDFPIGTMVYEPTGWMGFPRVSPAGDLVAFLDYPSVGDTAGSVAIVDRKGRVERLSGVWAATQGLAWSPDGKEIWFTASNAAARALHAVSLDGRERLVTQVPGGLHLHDISATGGVLLSHEGNRSAILYRIADQPSERELSWFDYSAYPDLSSDGKTLLFVEGGEGGGGPLFSTYLRPTDGSPAVRLGEGAPLALSPDGKRALSLASSPARLLLHPTRAGQTRELLHEGLTYHPFAAWFPDGKRILFAANEEGRHPRSYIQELDGSHARPVTPEGAIAYAISPDGRHLAAGDPLPMLYAVDGAEPIAIPGVLSGDIPIRWHQDGRFLFVRSGFLPAKVFRIDTATGLREPFLELMPSDTAGVACIDRISLTPDARSYAYSYAWMRSDLYLVEGLT